MIQTACQSPPPLIPRAVLFGNPAQVQPQISPDGKQIAYLAPHEGVLNIWVRSLREEDDRVVTREKGRGISNFFWAFDSQHFLFLKDQDGNENTHLYFADIVRGEKKDLTPFADVRVQVLAFEKNHPNTVLIAMNRENSRFYDAYRLNFKTGEMELAAKNDGMVSEWVADKNLQVRAAVKTSDNAGYAVWTRKTELSEWALSAAWGFEDNFTCHVLGFSGDGEVLYLVDSRGFSAGRLVRLDLNSGEKQVLAEDPNFDVVSVLMHPETGAPQIAFWIREKKEYQILDKSMEADVAAIEKDLGKNFMITSRDNADWFWTLRVESDTAPVAYYLYDRKNHQSRFLFEHQPELRRYRLAQMEPFSFTARDGLVIHGYLTFPIGKNRKNLPLVLKVHGGPWSRDVWGYDARAQWLANRGYLCLQVNFRGSTTYGKDFLNAGNKEWGGKMQNDLTDAVEWAVREGYADPKRIAIFGGSYGGYAALAGAAFTPELFRAAIAVVGPSNLLTFIQTTPPYWATELENIYRRVGHFEKDADFLRSRSPLFSADKIKIPMLIAQGANDPRVKKAESDQIVEALKRHKIPHEYLLFSDEGHGFARPENQMRFFESAEKFLARHLGGAFEK